MLQSTSFIRDDRVVVRVVSFLIEQNGRFRHQARFVIVGEGELEGELKALASELDLGERFIFTGFRTDVEAAMDGFDIFAMP